MKYCKFEGCSYKHQWQSKITQHDTAVHQLIKDFKCDTCPKAFGRSSNLKRHIQIVHLKEKQHMTILIYGLILVINQKKTKFFMFYFIAHSVYWNQLALVQRRQFWNIQRLNKKGTVISLRNLKVRANWKYFSRIIHFYLLRNLFDFHVC